MGEPIPVATNLINSDPNADITDIIVTNSESPPMWFETTGEFDDNGVPVFDYYGQFPTFTFNPLAVGDLIDDGASSSDGDIDVITTDDDNYLVYYRNRYDTDGFVTFEGPTTISSTTGQISFPTGENVYPYISDYNGDSYLDLIILYGPEGVGSPRTIVCYKGTSTSNAISGWVADNPAFIQQVSLSQPSTIRAADLSIEMSGITGNNYQPSTGGRPNIIAKTFGDPFMPCYFQYIYEGTDDNNFGMPMTEGEPFNLDGSFSTSQNGHTYSWSMTGGTPSSSTDDKVVNFSYETVDNVEYDTFTIELLVEDTTNHETNTASVDIIVYDHIPEPIITGNTYPMEMDSSDPLLEKYVYSMATSITHSGDWTSGTIKWDDNYNYYDEYYVFTENTTYTGFTEIELAWDDEGNQDQCIAVELTDDDQSTAMKVFPIFVQNVKPECSLSLSSSESKITNRYDADIPCEDKNDDDEMTAEVWAPASDAGPADSIVTYEWYWGDPGRTVTTTSVPQSDFVYDNSGTYYINVRVQDNDGEWSDYSNNVEFVINDLSPDAPTITVSNDGTNIPAINLVDETPATDEGIVLTFDASASMPTPSPDTITQYFWDYDYDGVNFNTMGSGVSDNHTFFVDDTNRYKYFSIAAVAVDSDESVGEIGVFEYLRINDSGPTANIVQEFSSVEEGTSTYFDAHLSTSGSDAIVESQWDFDYDLTTFTPDPNGVWGNERTYAYHIFDTNRDGNEYGTSLDYNVAVKVIDSDGSFDIIHTTITIMDEKPQALLRKPNYGVVTQGSNPVLNWFDASETSSPIDEIELYEWDFDYDSSFDCQATSSGPMISHIFQESDKPSKDVAVRAKEIYGEYSDIASVSVTIVEYPTPKIAEINGDIYEEKNFQLDGSGSNDNDDIAIDPDELPHNNLLFFWDLDGDGETDDSTVISPLVSGIEADGSNLIPTLQTENRYIELPIKLKVKNNVTGLENNAIKTVKIFDADPTGPIIADLGIETQEEDQNYYVAHEIAGELYSAPGAKITFRAPEISGYPDIVNDYEWLMDYNGHDTGGEFIADYSGSSATHTFGSEKTFIVAVRKTDDDGSKVIVTRKVHVVKDSDEDGLLNDFSDDDDDNDGVDDVSEVYNAVFQSECTYTIPDDNLVNVQLNDVNPYDSSVFSGDIVSVIANIGIKHENPNDLELTIYLISGTSQITYPLVPNGGNNYGIYESFDLLFNDDGTPRIPVSYFKSQRTWGLCVEDTVTSNIGFVEYFILEITHESNPLNKDTDGDNVDDLEELTPRTDGYTSNPCVKDTDGDGWEDDKEKIEGTNPESIDTDGDTVKDSNDLDPLHDIMLKLDIHHYRQKTSFESNGADIYFRGKLGKQIFQTYQDEGVTDTTNTRSFETKGTYYLNIPDNEKEGTQYVKYNMEIEARDSDKDGSFESMLCNSDGDENDQEKATFQYRPYDETLSGELTGDANSENTNTEGSDIKIWFTISQTYADKIRTILVGTEDTYVNTDNGMRYIGDDSFYIVLVDQKTATNFAYRYYAYVIPKSIYYASNLNPLDDDPAPPDKTNDNQLALNTRVNIDDNDEFITRDFNSKNAPVSLEGIVKLNGNNGKPIHIYQDGLEKAITTDKDDNEIAELYPISSTWFDDEHISYDTVHSIGIPSAIINLIPNAPKISQSGMWENKANDDNAWYEPICEVITTVGREFWNGMIATQDLLLKMVDVASDLGMGLLISIGGAASTAASAVVNAYHGLEDQVMNILETSFNHIMENGMGYLRTAMRIAALFAYYPLFFNPLANLVHLKPFPKYWQGWFGLCAAMSVLEIAHYYFISDTLDDVKTKSGDDDVYDGMSLDEERAYLQDIGVYESETENDQDSSTSLGYISFDEVLNQISIERDPIFARFTDFYNEGGSSGHAVVIIGYYQFIFGKFVLVVDSNISMFAGPYFVDWEYAKDHDKSFIYVDGIGMAG